MSLLAVSNLSVEFSQRRARLLALDDISFTVEAGEILGFVGESGAGKSLTGAAIMGLIEAPGRMTGGRITLDGNRIDTCPETVRGRHIGMIFQDPLTSLNPLRTIGDQLVETITVHLGMTAADANARAGRLLDDVGIPRSRIKAFPHEFSGGMRQRIVIALALAAEPRLIIADEPTTALDVSIQAQILDLLVAICAERGASMILITHDIGVISGTTHRVAVMYSGRIVETGPTGEVIRAPRHPYTEGLMRATPDIDSVEVDSLLTQIKGSMPPLSELPPGCRFHPRCPHALDVCRREAPAMQDHVACHLYDADGVRRQ